LDFLRETDGVFTKKNVEDLFFAVVDSMKAAIRYPKRFHYILLTSADGTQIGTVPVSKNRTGFVNPAELSERF